MKKLNLLLLTLACVAEVRASDPSILTAFDTQSRNLDWYIVNDTVMGGRSNSRVEIVDNRLVFSGELNTKGGGFASTRSEPAQLDLGGVTSLVLKVRGDGRSYQMRLMSAKTRISYSANFTTEQAKWLEIELPVTSFLPTWRGRKLNRPPIDPDDVTSIGFMIADNRDGPFTLEVDWVGLDFKEPNPN
jgi:monofunctional biosynthetic peptidoglycan transglycosylase